MTQEENKRGRYIIHIDEDYLQTLYIQKRADTDADKVKVFNEVYDEIKSFLDGTSEEPTTVAYDWVDASGMPHHSWWVEDIDQQWKSGMAYSRQPKPAEVEQPADEDNALTEQRAYDDYQERSATAGDRGSMLAWAFICTMLAQLIGSKYFREPYVLAAGGIAYLLLSTLQSLWQTVTIWLVKCRIKRTGIELDDYPDWIGFGAWVFYWLKMIVLTATAIYAIVKFIALL